MSNVVELRPKTESWLTVKDVCEHYRFGRTWVYAQMKKGMPHHHIAGKVRFRISELDEWLGIDESGMIAQ